MTSLHVKNRVRRALTLLELVIVLTIIVAIAGIAVAMFPRLLARAHIASCSANIPELLKAIQMYEAVSLDGYPDRMDTLIVNGGDVASYLPNVADIQPLDLDDDEADALREAGIEYVTSMVEAASGGDDFHPSFWPYAEGDPGIRPIGDTETVAFLAPEAAQRLGLSSDENDRFVVFGLGTPCRMFGRTMNEAPVHFSDAMDGNPNEHYMRFVAIYQVGAMIPGDPLADPVVPDEYQTLPRARLRGVAAIHPGGLEGLAGHVDEYWEQVESDN